jgi:magnesium and cobalt transporter
MSEDRTSHAADENNRQQSGLKKFIQGFLNLPFFHKPEDREQLGVLLRDAEKQNLLDADALSMIEGVLNVSDMHVRDVMVPRSQMVVVEEDQSPEAFLPIMVESAHSRFPVIGDSRDEIKGVILAKDVLAFFAERSSTDTADESVKFSLRDLLRPAVIIPESKRLNVLLRDFRSNRNHMAIVVDEYGGVAGLVTIEDVLEQIVGDIEDEHDFDDDVFIVRHSDEKFTLKALTPVDEFNEHFDADFSDDEFDTIGGLLMKEFGRLPVRGETCRLGQFVFKVLRADSRRIYLVQMKISPEQADIESTGEN